MRALKILLRIILLFALGELLIRADQYFLFFQGLQFEVVQTVSRESEELTLLREKRFVAGDKDLRILVLGDSWIYGAGVDFNSIATQKLKQKLREEKEGRFENTWVFNSSTPSNNNLMNKITYFKYVDQFAPQVVLLAYNPNDVYGNQDEKLVRKEIAKDSAAVAPKNFKPATDEGIGVAQQVRRTLQRSKLIGFLAMKINMELKIKGLVVPGTEFHHLLYKAYLRDYRPWQKSQQHLDSIITDCKKRNIELIVYMVPELNMLDSYGIFDEQENLILDYFRERGVKVIRGVDGFRGYKSDDLALSRYDGHPNEKAHQIVADTLYKTLKGIIQPPR
jgi:lysophospholipase L1-like esterase